MLNVGRTTIQQYWVNHVDSGISNEKMLVKTDISTIEVKSNMDKFTYEGKMTTGISLHNHLDYH